MLDQYPVLKLRGRSGECELLDRLVADLREGRSRVWVLRGEAGIGKTALLDHLAGVASGCRVVRTAGVESEMELAYAGLHQFCSSMLGGVDHLPAPQRDALSVAFGLQAGPAPDQFMVGLAVLGLLTQAAEEQPQVCLIDDAQWLDQVSAQTLAFVARRLLAERVALVFAVRDGNDGGFLRAARADRPRSAGRRRSRAVGHGDPRSVGRAGQRSDRGRDAWQPACADRVAAWVDPRAAGGRFRAPGLDAVG